MRFSRLLSYYTIFLYPTNKAGCFHISFSFSAALPKAPLVRGKRSAVAVVNDSPVDCQSRDRIARRRLSAEQRDWGVVSLPPSLRDTSLVRGRLFALQSFYKLHFGSIKSKRTITVCYRPFVFIFQAGALPKFLLFCPAGHLLPVPPPAHPRQLCPSPRQGAP